MFLPGIFVPIAGLETPFRQIAEWNPLSSVATATRELFGNPLPASSVWPLQHAAIVTVVWSLVIIAVTAPLAVHRFRKLDVS